MHSSAVWKCKLIPKTQWCTQWHQGLGLRGCTCLDAYSTATLAHDGMSISVPHYIFKWKAKWRQLQKWRVTLEWQSFAKLLILHSLTAIKHIYITKQTLDYLFIYLFYFNVSVITMKSIVSLWLNFCVHFLFPSRLMKLCFIVLLSYHT